MKTVYVYFISMFFTCKVKKTQKTNDVETTRKSIKYVSSLISLKELEIFRQTVNLCTSCVFHRKWKTQKSLKVETAGKNIRNKIG